MARSQYIYIVQIKPDVDIHVQEWHRVLGVFTVKGEMVLWLDIERDVLPPYEVWRRRDGVMQHEHPAVKLDY